MNSFFIEFRDPLFGLIVFFVLIFVITFFSYWWGRYKYKEDSKHLDKFLKNFRTPPSQSELSNLISSGELSEKSWLLLAQSYFKSGDYEKSIEIYNELLHITTVENKQEIMFLLGKTYFKAGFLERSKQIFLEILKKSPRTPQALQYLLLVYERLRDYKSAMDVLEPLDALESDIALDTLYLKSLALLNNHKFTTEQKSLKLFEFYQSEHKLTYMIFEYLFKNNPELAWKSFDYSKCERLSDIFWRMDKKDLDFDIISNNGYLRDLYSARGDYNLSDSSSIFEFDVLINLQKKESATLNFEYVCSSCQQVYPFAFSRCSHCHSIDTQIVEFSLVKNYSRSFGEESNSFQ